MTNRYEIKVRKKGETDESNAFATEVENKVRVGRAVSAIREKYVGTRYSHKDSVKMPAPPTVDNF